MRFFQKYRFIEHDTGEQWVLFAVSDSHEELFENTGTEVDIFMLESIKRDLNIDEGYFAIDELPFSVNHLNCETEDDKKAMYFVLDAADVKVNRYCALFFSETPTLSEMQFLGKIGTKITGEDKTWEGDSYETDINPKREYKLSALSFDISKLEECKISGDIYRTDGTGETRIDNLRDRWLRRSGQGFDELGYQKVFYWQNKTRNEPFDTVDQFGYFQNMANLYDVLVRYLHYCEEILLEKDGIAVTIGLEESNMDFACQPATYTYSKAWTPGFRTEFWDVGQAGIQHIARLGSGNAPLANTGLLFINLKMVDPFANSTPSDLQASNERAYSFLSFEDMAQLLYAIAKSFGCYIFANYNAANSINIAFKSRSAIVETNYTRIYGATEANIDTSFGTTNKARAYYAVANNYADEGADVISGDKPTDNFVKADAHRKALKNSKNIESELLLFSGSPTLRMFYQNGYPIAQMPLNSMFRKAPLIEESQPTNYYETAEDGKREYLHTSIYISCEAPEPEVLAHTGSHSVLRPVAGFVLKLGGVNKQYTKLSDMITEIMGRDNEFYQTEYSLTIPSWNGFLKENDPNPSWKNIKLGSKIKLSELVTRFTGTEWIEGVSLGDYTVVGIEVDLQQPKTTLKLHSVERFAFGYWDGAELPSAILTPPVAYDPKSALSGVKNMNYIIKDGEIIGINDSVDILPDGKIAKTRSISTSGGIPIGIATESGIGGETIAVQIAGKVYSPDFNFVNIGGYLYARTNAQGSNLTEMILSAPNYTEDLIIILGKIDSEKSFILDIRELKFESGVILQT